MAYLIIVLSRPCTIEVRPEQKHCISIVNITTINALNFDKSGTAERFDPVCRNAEDLPGAHRVHTGFLCRGALSISMASWAHGFLS